MQIPVCSIVTIAAINYNAAAVCIKALKLRESAAFQPFWFDTASGRRSLVFLR